MRSELVITVLAVLERVLEVIGGLSEVLLERGHDLMNEIGKLDTKKKKKSIQIGTVRP